MKPFMVQSWPASPALSRITPHFIPTRSFWALGKPGSLHFWAFFLLVTPTWMWDRFHWPVPLFPSSLSARWPEAEASVGRINGLPCSLAVWESTDGRHQGEVREQNSEGRVSIPWLPPFQTLFLLVPVPVGPLLPRGSLPLDSASSIPPLPGSWTDSTLDPKAL